MVPGLLLAIFLTTLGPSLAFAQPAAPSNLRNDSPDVFSVILRWNDNSNREDGFRVAKLDEGEDINNPVHWDNAAVVGQNVTAVRVTGLVPNSTYWFKVRSYNQNGYSAYSNIIQLTTASDLPASPSNLRSDPPDAFSVILRWDDNSPQPGFPFDEDGFRISRLDEGEDINNPAHWDQVAQVGMNDHAERVYGLQPNRRYWFRVRAFNAYGNSGYSNILEVVTGASVPGAPTNLRSDPPDPLSMIVRWNDNAPMPGFPVGEDGYNISRLDEGEDINNPGHWDQVGQVGANTTAYRVPNLQPDTRYWIRVRAYNANGYSAYSNVLEIRTGHLEPAGPTNLFSSTVGYESALLHWTDNSPNFDYPTPEDGFNISRLDPGEDPNNPAHWDQVGQVDPNVTSFLAEGLDDRSTYLFRVRARSVNGFSEYSNVATVETSNAYTLSATHVQFPDLRLGGSSSAQLIQITNNQITGVTVIIESEDPAHFAILSGGGSIALSPGQSHQVSVVAQAPNVPGVVLGDLAFRGPTRNYVSRLKQVVLPANDGSVTPVTLMFGTVPAYEESTLDLQVTNDGPGVAMVTAAQFPGSFHLMGPDVAIPAGQSTNLSIAFRPLLEDAYFAPLDLGVSQTIWLQGQGAEGAPGECDPQPDNFLAFGSVPVGDIRTLPVSMHNAGGQTLELSPQLRVAPGGPAYVGSEFSLQSVPTTVGPSAIETLNVTFSPGTVEAASEVTLDWGGACTTAVQLVGSGISAPAVSLLELSFESASGVRCRGEATSNGDSVQAFVEYGIAGGFAETTAALQLGDFETSHEAVDFLIPDLSEGSVYEFRLVAESPHYRSVSEIDSLRIPSVGEGGNPFYAESFDGAAVGVLESSPGGAGQLGWYAELMEGDAVAEIRPSTGAGQSQAPGNELRVLAPLTNPPGLQTIARQVFLSESLAEVQRVSLGFRFQSGSSDLDAVNPYTGQIEVRGGPHPGYQILGVQIGSGNGVAKAQAGLDLNVARFDAGNANNIPAYPLVGQDLAWDDWITVRVDADPSAGEWVEIEVDGETESLTGWAVPRSFDGTDYSVGQRLDELSVSIVPSLWAATGEITTDWLVVDDLILVLNYGETATAIGDEPTPGGSRAPVLRVLPNPATDGSDLLLAFQLVRPEAIELSVYDLRGRRVGDAVWRLPAGAQRLGLDSLLPRKVARGAYFVRLRTKDWEVTRKFSIVR